MNSPPTPAYIPPELEEKHRLRAAVRVPNDALVTERITGERDPRVLRQLEGGFARELAGRVSVCATTPFDYNARTGFLAEIFVFTREELAAVLERHYLVMESLPPIP